jgi:hypothetical protein
MDKRTAAFARLNIVIGLGKNDSFASHMIVNQLVRSTKQRWFFVMTVTHVAMLTFSERMTSQHTIAPDAPGRKFHWREISLPDDYLAVLISSFLGVPIKDLGFYLASILASLLRRALRRRAVFTSRSSVSPLTIFITARVILSIGVSALGLKVLNAVGLSILAIDQSP